MQFTTFTPAQVRSLQRGVRAALVFGVATSITANVIHAIINHHVGTAGWLIWSSIGLAALAPLILFVSTEMVTRIPIQSRVLGWVRLVITLALASIAGWISYWHMASVASLLGEQGGAQYLYPLIIDGMMIVATISLIELGRLARTVTTFVASAAAAEADAAALAAADKAAADKAAAAAAAQANAAAAAQANAHRAAQAKATAARQAAAEAALVAARAEALYEAMTPGEKSAWTKTYYRQLAAAPTSPGRPPVSAPSTGGSWWPPPTDPR
jgi:hypothetical protein